MTRTRLGCLVLWGSSLVAGVAGPSPVAAQPREPIAWYSRAYHIEDGLPSSVIHAIAQDDNGYLWLGTGSGLVRFDGTQFVEWSRRGDVSLPVDDVLALVAAKDGSLWLGFSGSGGVIRLRGGRAETYPNQSETSEGSIYALLQDRDGVLWSGSRGGLARFAHGRWERLGTEAGVPAAMTVFRLFEDRRGRLWAATSAGVYRRGAPDGAFERVSSEFVRDFVEDGAGTMWVTDETTAFRRFSDAPRRQVPATDIGTQHIGTRLFSDGHGGMWVGTMGGLMRAAAAGKEPAALEQMESRDGPIDAPVQAMFRDRDGAIWVGTRGGLCRFFEHDVTMLTSRDGLVSNTIGALTTTPDGRVWVGTADGLNAFSAEPGSLTQTRYVLPALRATAMHSDRLHRLWIASEAGVGYFQNGVFTRLDLPERFPRGRILAITSDAADRLWLCHSSLSRWDGGRLTELDGDPALRGKSCTSAHTDAHGTVWIGFADGTLGSYANGAFRFYSAREGLPASPVITLYSDAAGSLWIASYDALSRFKDGRFTALTERNGIPGRKVTAIVDDEQGNLWLALNVGIVRVSKAEFDRVAAQPAHRITYALFDSSDGLTDAPSYHGSPTSARGGDGRLWFQTVRGVAVIDPRRSQARRSLAVPQIERLIADGHLLTPGPDGFSLPPHPATVEIDYTAVSLTAASKVRFRYLLDGFDKDWVSAGSRRQAFYTRLPPGTFRFRVRAEIDGAEQSTGTYLLTVEPALYERTWFYGLSAFGVALMLWGAWRWRTRALREQFALVLAERARIGREIHDTVLQSMAGVAMQLEGVTRRIDASPAVAKQHLRRVRRQLEQHIDEARDSILAVRSSGEPKPLVVAIGEFVERLVAETARRVQVDVFGEPRLAPREIEQELIRIGQEAIRNAVRHADPEQVRVEIHYDPAAIRLRVQDDGHGFDPAEAMGRAEHWGLTGMQERARKIGARFDIQTHAGRGTSVEVVVDDSAPLAGVTA